MNAYIQNFPNVSMQRFLSFSAMLLNVTHFNCRKPETFVNVLNSLYLGQIDCRYFFSTSAASQRAPNVEDGQSLQQKFFFLRPYWICCRFPNCERQHQYGKVLLNAS